MTNTANVAGPPLSTSARPVYLSAADEFTSMRSGQVLAMVNGVLTPTYNHGVFVADMEGDDFHAQLIAGVALAHSEGVPLILPGGYVDLDETWVWAVNGTSSPLTQANLFNNMTIFGNGTVINWTGGTNRAMFEMPSPNRVSLIGPLNLNGNSTTGLMGMWCRTAWDYNRNGMRNVVVDNVTFTNLKTAAFTGDSLGPDFRPGCFRSCFVTSSMADSDGFVYQGANVTSQHVVNCSINVKRWGIHCIDSSTDVTGAYFNGTTDGDGGGDKGFDSGKITDPWGNVWGPDFHDSAGYPNGPEVWNKRVFAGGSANANTRHQDIPGGFGGSYGGDAAAKIIGGGPVVTVRDCDSVGGASGAVFAKTRRCSISIQEIRLEGSGDLFECTETWAPGYTSNRFYTIIQDCTSSNSGIAINNQGGPNVIVRGGRYSTSTAISTGGSGTTIMEGVIYAGGQELNATGNSNSYTTAAPAVTPGGGITLDGSSNAVAATLAAGEFVGQISTIVASNVDNAVTLSIANHVTSSPELFTFGTAGMYVVVVWLGSEWATLTGDATT